MSLMSDVTQFWYLSRITNLETNMIMVGTPTRHLLPTDAGGGSRHGVLRLHALVALGVEEAGLGESGVGAVEPGEDGAVTKYQAG